jgi:hypothetical protein
MEPVKDLSVRVLTETPHKLFIKHLTDGRLRSYEPCHSVGLFSLSKNWNATTITFVGSGFDPEPECNLVQGQTLNQHTLFYFSASFNVLPALNLGTLTALI